MIGDEARHLVSQLLCASSFSRISASDGLTHPWIARREVAPRMHLQPVVLQIAKYNERRRLKVSFFEMNGLETNQITSCKGQKKKGKTSFLKKEKRGKTRKRKKKEKKRKTRKTN